jgi:hypothetical protein
LKTAADFQTSSSNWPSITGGLLKSGSFTGFAFSGGRTNADFPEAGFVAVAEFVTSSGGGEVAGLGVIGAGAVAGSNLSLLDAAGSFDDVDCARDKGEKKKTRAAASTRDFIVLETLLGLSQNYRSGSH